MIRIVNTYSVADIFSPKNGRYYKIPKYQRDYAWGVKEWNALFKDICENENGYFLGSYICVNPGGSIGEITLELIDGQQRFATIAILLAAIYARLVKYKDKMNEDECSELSNLKKMLSIKKDRETCTQRLILQGQNLNNEDYAYILSEVEIISPKKGKPQHVGNRRIHKAYQHFGKLIGEEVTELTSQELGLLEVDALFRIVGKIESAVLVGIEVETSKDAYMLFESLNHRGIPLSAIDLIKNTLIAEAEADGGADDAYDQWQRILSDIGADDYSMQERFFRQYYNAFREDLNRPYADQSGKSSYHFGYLATRTTLMDIYEKMIKSGYRRLLDDLAEKSRKYSVVVGVRKEGIAFADGLQDLARISGAPSYILLLYLLSNQDRLELSDMHISEVISFLTTFFVRRNLTDVPNTRKLTQLFIDIVSELKELRGAGVVSFVKGKLKSISAPDSTFEEKLRGPVYDDNPEATRFVLCGIEKRNQTKEIYSDLWVRKEKKYVWTIEHIFPQGDKIPNAWVDMVAGGDKQLAEKYRQEYVHTLGNLTITGYNQNLSNLSFIDKKERKSRDGKEIGYKNGLYLNQDVVNKNQWTIDCISARTESLVQILLKMYSW